MHDCSGVVLNSLEGCFDSLVAKQFQLLITVGIAGPSSVPQALSRSVGDYGDTT